MSIPIVNSADDQARRLRHKTQDARLAHLAVEGAGISPWEADVLVEVVNEVYFAEPEEHPLQAGQMRYVCIAASEGAGKALKGCKQQTVVLNLLDRDDPQVLRIPVKLDSDSGGKWTPVPVQSGQLPERSDADVEL